MNSTIEYIRQLNQASVTLPAEWLKRLQNIDAGPDASVATPEIVLTERAAIPAHAEGDFKPPVTIVEHQEAEPASPQTETSGEPVIEEVAALPNPDSCVQIVDATGSCMVSPESLTTVDVTETSQAGNSPVPKQQAAKDPAPSLEAPAILNGIVRPTIMPLRPQQGQDVITSTAPAVPEKTPHESTPEENPAPDGPPQPIQSVPNQVIEMLGDFGVNDESIYTNDTLDREDVEQLISNVDPRRVCLFPTDQRGERFTYELTKRKRLIDSIVDQIIARFPSNSNPTIMFVGANRGIDVDSAASRIATCLASRELGEVLLVDGNVQSRQLSSVLGLNGTPGISESFLGKTDVSNVICNTDNPSLKIIGAGIVECQEGDELPAVSITDGVLKKRFAYTIISGGVAGDTVTDVWCGLADGIYMIVDMEESDRTTTTDSVNRFRKSGARIVGCIATRA